MPDPGAIPSTSDKQSDTSRPAAAAEKPAPLAPAPRLHPPNIRQPRNAEKARPVPPPPGLNQVLAWMKQKNGHIEAKSAAAPEGPLPVGHTPRLQLPKDQRKFHKYDPEHPSLPVMDDEQAPGEEPYFENAPLPATEHLKGISAEQMLRLRRLQSGGPAYGAWIAAGLGVCVFLAMAAAFFWRHPALSRIFSPGRNSSETTVISNTMPIEISAGILTLIDEATVAESTKDYAKAIERLEQAQRDGKHVYGLDFHLATLYLKLDDPKRALPLLNRSIIEGEQVAPSCNLRGALASRSGAPDRGLPDLEKATQIDPFNARYFFDWGEALRRAGSPRLALAQLQRAVDRLQEPALLPVYALKIRLTKLELGQEDAFVDELDARLKQSPVPTDWLLTAAAVEMRRSDFPAAAEYLNQVRASIGEHETMKQLQDVYFAGFAHEKALVNFFEGSTSPVNVTPP